MEKYRITKKLYVKLWILINKFYNLTYMVKNNELYSDNNPSTTLIGTGFVDENKAVQTLRLIRKRSIIYQKSVVNTMYNRAKFHPNKTKNMIQAMKIFKKWMIKNNKTKRKYEYLPLKIINKYEKFIKSSKLESFEIFSIYKKIKGKFNKMPFILIDENKPDGMDYDIFREKILNKLLKKNLPLYNSSGLPTKYHLLLIMNAYSPNINNL